MNLIGQKDNLEKAKSIISRVKNENGSIICISGETGFGKSSFLQAISESFKDKSDFNLISIESQPPIGKFNVGNLQAMYPFAKAIEMLRDNKHLTAEKRLYMNIGMTALASIPLVGDIFYAVKELGKDVREFKKEKSSDSIKNLSSVTKDFYDSILAFSLKKPLIILMDDVHWIDAQSVELLNAFAGKIDNLPLCLVLAYKQSSLEQKGLPFYSFVRNHGKDTKTVHSFQLDQFDKKDVSEYFSKTFPDYKQSSELENWIIDHSFGVPGIVTEYVRYFQHHIPFDAVGNINIDLKTNDYLPATLNKLFSEELEDLTEEEKNILAICSAEGREFTVTIISQLLNYDVLTTIKKLRALQNKTAIIKSLGAQVKYGIKTTTYKFTQAFYQEFFEKMLEYEEYTALHGQIAGLLKLRFDESESDEIKEEIAPFIAAHSVESGDKDMAESMFLLSAETAKKYGTFEILKHTKDYLEDSTSDEDEFNKPTKDFFDDLKDTFGNLPSSNSDYSESNSAETTGNTNNQFLDFKLFRKSIVSDFIAKNYRVALEKIINFISDNSHTISEIEHAQLMMLKSRCHIELQEYTDSLEALNFAKHVAESKDDIFNQCLIFNSYAIHYAEQNDSSNAIYYLERASHLSINLPPELKLITITNIGLIYKDISPNKAKQYMEAAKHLSSSLDFDSISQLLNEVF